MRNHHLPEFYFRPWLDETGHLVRFGWIRGVLKCDPKTPAQICYVKDLHTFTRAVDECYLRRLFDKVWWVADFSTTSFGTVVATVRLPLVQGTGLDDPNSIVVLLLGPQKVLYRTPDGFQRRLATWGLGALGVWTQRLLLSNAP